MTEGQRIVTDINDDFRSMGWNIDVKYLNEEQMALPRRHKQAEAYMGQRFIPTHRRLQWFINHQHSSTSISLAELFHGAKAAYVVGKGPSLDRLTAETFKEDWPIVCINQAGTIVEKLGLPNPLYVVQQDFKGERTSYIKNGTMILSTNASHHYRDIDNKYIYVPSDLRKTEASLTTNCALELLAQAGVRKVAFVAFDGMNGTGGYATKLERPATFGGSPNRFIRHGQMIQAFIKSLGLDYTIIPTPHETQADGNTSQEGHSPQDSHEKSDAQFQGLMQQMKDCT